MEIKLASSSRSYKKASEMEFRYIRGCIAHYCDYIKSSPRCSKLEDKFEKYRGNF